jgi:hypothetical protein
VNAWDKRVSTARKVRLQQEEELETKFDLPQPPPVGSGSSPTASRPAPNVLSNEEVKRREMENAQAQLGFNPYAPVFSSSTEVGAATNAIGGSAGASAATSTVLPPPAPVSTALSTSIATSSSATTENGAVYVLLRQEPARAITAAETIIKMLNNILQNPQVRATRSKTTSRVVLTNMSSAFFLLQEDKFRRVRLSNAGIQSKLVAVAGALDILREAGFSETQENGESFLVLGAEQFDSQRVQSAVDRTEVALMQLRVDSVGL